MMTLSNEELCDKIAKKLAANPGLKTGMLADTLGVTEAAILQAMPEGYATKLSIENMEEFVTGLENLGLIYFVIRNDACVTEIKGRFSGFSKSGPFLNVSGEALHLHLRIDKIAFVFHVKPPVQEGKPSWPSLQFFTEDGRSAFKVFLIESMQREAGDDYEKSLAELGKLTAQEG